jgi:hypothetical protein
VLWIVFLNLEGIRRYLVVAQGMADSGTSLVKRFVAPAFSCFRDPDSRLQKYENARVSKWAVSEGSYAETATRATRGTRLDMIFINSLN